MVQNTISQTRIHVTNNRITALERTAAATTGGLKWTVTQKNLSSGFPTK